jgi:hypothetical protein
MVAIFESVRVLWLIGGRERRVRSDRQGRKKEKGRMIITCSYITGLTASDVSKR